MMIRQIQADRKFCQQLEMPALQQVIAPHTLRRVLQECGQHTRRQRKLNLEVTMWLLIAMNLFSDLSMGRVLEKVAYGLRLLWPPSENVLAGESALTYRRYQLGVRPLVALFRQVCKPIATPETPGAFRFGLRLMALDGHITNLPDTPENAAYFGRSGTDRGQSAWPQVKGVYLSECGTHAVVDVGLWPYNTSEHLGAKRLLRSVEEGMLVMWDRGLHSYDLVEATLARGAQFLGRLPANVKPLLLKRLSDGSWLVRLLPSEPKRRAQHEGVIVRLIVYTLTDAARSGYAQTHRVITSLLCADLYPGEELACTYHERWEEEVLFDEIETHQQAPDTLLRSRKPVGVLQELYALLVAHYAVRFLMHEAAQKAHLDPDRISFTRALHLIDLATTTFALMAPEEIACYYERLLEDLARKPLPPRRLRAFPRVVKRKMSTFALKRPEREPPPRRLKPFREAVLLI
jgi:Insertion element 4 transposase N-terminal/Transposase DDE domain